MPRSPAEGAATRAAAELEISSTKPTRDRRVRSGVDRRSVDHGPPHGIERRRTDRRSHDRRHAARVDRRNRSRRVPGERRGARPLKHAHLVQRQILAREPAPSTQMPRLLRAIIITAVAVACLLAATLTGDVERAGAATPKKAVPGSVSATAGGVSATVTYERVRSYGSTKIYRKLRLTVKGAGHTSLKKVKLGGNASESWLTRPIVQLADVTGDGVPDPVIGTYTGGAHCCGVSAVAASSGASWVRPVVRNWADYGFELKDLGGAAGLEFVGRDSRFNGAYTSYAASRSPLQVFRFANGTYTDVTREFPDALRADAAEQAKGWADAGDSSPKFRSEEGRGALAAWVADLALLGDNAAAAAAVKGASDRGDFKSDRSSFLSAGFPGQLGHDLLTWGYTTDPTLLGLSNAPAPGE